MPSKPSLFALVSLMAATVIMTLGAGELVVRLLPAPDDLSHRVHQFTRAMVVDDPQLSHRLRPSHAVSVGQVEYRTNRLGVRGAVLKSDPTHPRVLFLGDSVTMGWGVGVEQTYPVRFGVEMAARGLPVSVINGGVLAYGVHQYGPWMTRLLTETSPDLVLVGYYPNDPESIESSLRRGDLGWSHLLRRLGVAFNGFLVRIGVKADAHAYYRALHAEDGESWKGVVDALTDLRQRCTQAKIPCGLVLIPALIGDPYPLRAEHERLARLAETLGLPVLDLAQSYPDGDPRRFWVTSDDAHPNGEAHASYARVIAAWAPKLLTRRQ